MSSWVVAPEREVMPMNVPRNLRSITAALVLVVPHRELWSKSESITSEAKDNMTV